jgi:hypothetical protein
MLRCPCRACFSLVGVGGQCRGLMPFKGKIYMQFLDFGRLIEALPACPYRRVSGVACHWSFGWMYSSDRCEDLHVGFVSHSWVVKATCKRM